MDIFFETYPFGNHDDLNIKKKFEIKLKQSNLINKNSKTGLQIDD